MKKISFLLIFSFSIIFMLSAMKASNPYKKMDSIAEKVAVLYTANFYKFQEEVNALVLIANKPASLGKLKAVKEQVEKTRLSYKSVEFIFDYYQTFYNGAFINGAPLPKVSEYYEEGNVIEPCGLQALDEAVFEEVSQENNQHIKELAYKLKEKVDFVSNRHLPISLESSQIIECIRSGMVRIFTMGITGFDTPGSTNALKESYVSFESMETTFLLFEEGIHAEAEVKFKDIKSLFKKGKKMLKENTSFNDFDRMVFLKDIVNPLYSDLLDFQNLNKTELKPFKKHAQNYQAKNIFDINFINTDFYSELVYLPLDNPKTIQLGKLLFADPQLSNDNKMSCLSCHNPNKGFGDGLPKSLTNQKGVFTDRHSPSIINAGYSTRYFWDMREYNLEKQVMHVVNNDLEFNTDFDAIITKLNKDSKYLKLFKIAYGDISKQDINQRSVSNAIAAYVNSLKSLNSPFDKYVRYETNEYPEKAKRGFNLFMGKAMCGTCHFAPVFNGTVPPFYIESESEVLGITVGFDSIEPKLDKDLGRLSNGLKIDKNMYFKNSFKTVSVRNSDLTAPYMHNGSFETLEDVISFYNLGGGAGMGLSVENQTLSNAPLNLSKQEMKDIIAFIKTLTDTSVYDQ